MGNISTISPSSRSFDFRQYDTHQNDMFVFANRVLHQKRGLAIGGTGSPQLASITLSVAEEFHYPCVKPVSLDAEGLHPCDLPTHPARFRDNIVGLKRASVPLDHIMQNLEVMYALDLQIESEGTQL